MAALMPDDLAAWFTTRMNVAAVTTAVTGGVWNGRPLETAGATGSAPYLVFNVDRLAKSQWTSRGEVPFFNIRAAVLVDQTAATVAQATQNAVAEAMPVAPTGATAMIRSGAGTVISAEPRDCSANVEFPKRAANDVVGCRMSWELMCQGFTS